MEYKTAVKQVITLLAFCAAAGIALFGVLALFNQPTIDDYWYTWMVKKFGFWEAQHQWYITINARYSSNACMSFNSLVWGSVIFYKVFPLALLAGYAGLFTWFTKKVILPAANITMSLSLGLFFTAVFCYGMPGFYEGFYWSSALMGYQVPFLLWGFTIMFLFNQPNHISAAGYVLWGLFILFLSGFHELMALHITVVMAFLLWKKGKSHQSKPRLYWIALCCASASLIFQVISTGNLHKAQITAEKTVSYDFYQLILPLLQFAYHLLRATLLNPLFLLMVVFISWFGSQSGIRLPGRFSVSAREMLIISLLVWILATGPVYLVGQIEGTKTPLRVINFSYGLLFLWFLYLAFWVQGFKRPYFLITRDRAFGAHAILILLIFCITILVKGGPVVSPLADGSAALYNRQVNNRFEIIKKSGSDTTLISCLDAQPLTLCPVDVCNDPTLLGYLEKVFNKPILISDSLVLKAPLP